MKLTKRIKIRLKKLLKFLKIPFKNFEHYDYFNFGLWSVYMLILILFKLSAIGFDFFYTSMGLNLMLLIVIMFKADMVVLARKRGYLEGEMNIMDKLMDTVGKKK